MKALHIFPQFSPDSVNGSERYEYMLSRKLVELGIEVELFTTATRDFVPAGPFCLQWPRQHTELAGQCDGISIRRFPAWVGLPASVGRLVSEWILGRWKREEERYGTMLKGSRNQIDYFHRRAIERPLIYDVIATFGRGPYSFGLLRNLVPAMRRCDIVQVGFTPFATAWQAVAMARLLRKPVVVLALFHPEDLSHHFRSIYWSFSAADAILTQTVYSSEILRRLLPASTPVTVGAGIDLAQLGSTAACGARFRTKYNLHDKKLALLVGRKERFKRYDIAIEALQLIDDERFHLVMIGRDIDRQPVSSRRVTYLGEVSNEELADAYDACDVFVMPSENESFGMVFLEAWARRKPVIGNRSCGAVACLIDDGENGFLCSSAEQIAARIIELVANPELARKLGGAGHKKVAARHTWEALAERVRDLYAQLANRTAAGAYGGKARSAVVGTHPTMDLKDLKRHWNSLGKLDPLWAALTDARFRNNRWDAGEFFRTGERWLDSIYADLNSRGLSIPHGRCLDFGCGVGRLSQALCRHFESCDGVDIAPSMIGLARRYNRYGERCRYHVNDAADLRLFADASFDFVCSLLVLQHMRPHYARRYIAEFIRVLKPGGLAAFQLPGAYIHSSKRSALPDSAYRAVITASCTRLEMAPGQSLALTVAVRNESKVTWPEHRANVNDFARLRLGNHWRDRGGRMLVENDGRIDLPGALHPGQEAVLQLTVKAPERRADYWLELDLVEEGVTWFAPRGSHAPRIEVRVRPAYGGLAGVAGAAFRSLAPRSATGGSDKENNPVMETHCVPRAEVLDSVKKAGGRVLHQIDNDWCGGGFGSVLYVATRD